MLENAVSTWPEENSSFPHVSGITFSVNVLNGAGSRVYNAKIENPETGAYEALDPNKMYTVASNNFVLLECGDGMTMFEGAEVVSDTGILDVDVLKDYIVDDLGGVIGEEYARIDYRVTFTEGEVADSSGFVYDGGYAHAVWIAVIGIILAGTTLFIGLRILKKRCMSQS